MDAPEPVRRALRQRRVLGHPLGLGVLMGAEGFERFSYYGMQSLLVLYMGHRLFMPGVVGRVAGLGAIRAALEQLYGPLTPVALASNLFGLYAGGVYLTPIVGGFLADRVMGRTRTIVMGGCLMAVGHFLMAFEALFLPALACLLLGVGCFKGNIATQVGELYGPGDPRRASGFQAFVFGISIAAIAAPLVCGTLGQKLAWGWGFAAAGVGMLLGLGVYLAGRSCLPADPPRRQTAARRVRLSKGEAATVLVLLVMLPGLALAFVGNQEIFDAYLVWGEAHYDLTILGQTLPVSWLISLDAIVGTAIIALSLGFWRWWSSRWREPDELTKLVGAALVLAIAPLILALASLQERHGGQKIGLGWAIAFHLVNDIGFSNFYPVGLALFSRAAPKAVGGAMIGVFYLSLFAANMIVGRVGGLLETMSPPAFWLLHAGLVGTGTALLMVFHLLFRRRLAPTSEWPARTGL